MDDDRWDARAWIASIIGCPPDELDMVQRGLGADGRVWLYERAGKPAGRLVIRGPIRRLDGTAGGHYIVAFELPDKTGHQVEVPDSADFTF